MARRTLSLLLISLAACATAEPEPAPPAARRSRAPAPKRAPEPEERHFFDLRETPGAAAFAPEDLELPEQRFTSDDGRYSGALFSSAPVRHHREAGSGFEQLDAELRAGHTLTCTIRPEVRPGTELERLVDGLSMNLVVSGVAVADVEAVNGHPLLVVELLYRPRHPPGSGDYQVAYLPAFGGASLLCTHDGTAYRETFLRAVRRLAQTLRDAAAPPHPLDEASVDALRLYGRLAGYVFTEDSPARADGSFESRSETVKIAFNAKSAKLLAVDALDVEQVDAEGALLERRSSLDEERVRGELQVRKTADGYVVSGTRGKGAVHAVLPLSPAIWFPKPPRMLELLAGSPAELALSTWDPSQPERVRRHTLRADGEGGLSDRSDDLDAPVTTLRLDARGYIASMRTQLRGGAGELIRLWRLGAPER